MYGFRKTNMNEVAELMRIADAARHLLKSRNVDQWQNEKYPSQELFEADIKAGISYVMTDGDHIVGMCALTCADDPMYAVIDGAWLTPEGTRYAVAHRGALAPEYQGQGLTRKWFELIADEARKLGAVSLRIDTHGENIAMRRSFIGAGFKECGIVQLSEDYADVGSRTAYEMLL